MLHQLPSRTATKLFQLWIWNRNEPPVGWRYPSMWLKESFSQSHAASDTQRNKSRVCWGLLTNIWRCTNNKLRTTFLIFENAPCPINCLLHRDTFSINFLRFTFVRAFILTQKREEVFQRTFVNLAEDSENVSVSACMSETIKCERHVTKSSDQESLEDLWKINKHLQTLFPILEIFSSLYLESL